MKLYQFLKSISILLPGLLSSACSLSDAPESYKLTQHEGLAFFSLSRTGLVKGKLELEFSDAQNEHQYTITLSPDEHIDFGAFNKQSDLPYDKPAGKLVALRLPEGIYKLNQWRLLDSGAEIMPSRTNINKQFRVANGKALYLGNLNLIQQQDNQRVVIKDRRYRDIDLFLSMYKQVKRESILISSAVFLNPGEYHSQVINSFTNCDFIDGLKMVSQQRLPSNSPKYRVLKQGEEEIKISRTDGIKIKLAYPDELPQIIMKIEFSAGAKYQDDKRKIADWFAYVEKAIPEYQVTHRVDGIFNYSILDTGVLDEKHYINDITAFVDNEQMILDIMFINPVPEKRRYQDAKAFNTFRDRFLQSYQQCVASNLNR